MNRTLTAIAAFLTASTGLTFAGVAPPIPRLPSEVAKRLAPQPDAPAEAEDAAKIADRILHNTRDAADRLSQSDPGSSTQQKQDEVLRDLDALLKQAENPPPMGGGGAGDQNKDQKNQGQGGGKQGGSPPMGGGGQSGSNQQASGGESGKQSGGASGSRSQSWREKRRQEQQARGGKDQGAREPGRLPDPTGSGQRADLPSGPGGKKDPAGGPAGNDRTGRTAKSPPTLPVDESIAKQVWGHLPEKLRQQMSQYYQEQFMPKYDDLLRQYFAALAEREKSQKK